MTNHSRLLLPAAAVALALAVGLVTGAAGPARAQCIASTAICQGTSSTPTGPTYSDFCENIVLGISGVAFDVPAKMLRVTNDDPQSIAELFLRDEFVVQGPPAGSPITLHLRIRYHGTAGWYCCGNEGLGFLEARPVVAQAGDPPVPQKSFTAVANSSSPAAFDDSLDLVLQRTAGAPIGLELHARVESGYGDELTGHFVFLDLPPGATVTSCKGYAQEQPVAASVRSWGSVKAAYR